MYYFDNYSFDDFVIAYLIENGLKNEKQVITLQEIFDYINYLEKINKEHYTFKDSYNSLFNDYVDVRVKNYNAYFKLKKGYSIYDMPSVLVNNHLITSKEYFMNKLIYNVNNKNNKDLLKQLNNKDNNCVFEFIEENDVSKLYKKYFNYLFIHNMTVTYSKMMKDLSKLIEKYEQKGYFYTGFSSVSLLNYIKNNDNIIYKNGKITVTSLIKSKELQKKYI